MNDKKKSIKTITNKYLWGLFFLSIASNLVYADGPKFNLFSSYYYQLMSVNNKSFLNPDNMFSIPQSNSRLAVNLEFRPKLWKLKFIVSPLIEIDHHSEYKTNFREFNGNLSIGNLEITFGRSLISLGTGYVFTPISVITPELKISDPEDSLRTNKGVDLLKMDFFTENFHLSTIIFKKTNWRNYALLAYYNLAGFDLYGILY